MKRDKTKIGKLTRSFLAMVAMALLAVGRTKADSSESAFAHFARTLLDVDDAGLIPSLAPEFQAQLEVGSSKTRQGEKYLHLQSCFGERVRELVRLLERWTSP